MIFDNRRHFREIEKQLVEKQNVYQKVFGTEDGKIVLEDLRKRCFVDHTTYSDIHGQMSFNEGRRSVFMHIDTILKKDIRDILEDLTVKE